jgi:predicted TIM-barrel fold metal-dependent hydrolase
MFGSDLPENMGVELIKLKSLDLNEDELGWILGKTADTVFGLGI